MNAIIKCSHIIGEETKEVVIDCNITCIDVDIRDDKYVCIFAHNVSIDEKSSSKDYKDFFEVTPDGDYHILVEYKKPINSFLHYSANKENGNGKFNILVQGA